MFLFFKDHQKTFQLCWSQSWLDTKVGYTGFIGTLQLGEVSKFFFFSVLKHALCLILLTQVYSLFSFWLNGENYTSFFIYGSNS